MENKQMKCIKGESCLHCGSNYCRFVDELDQLKAENEELKSAYTRLNSLYNDNCNFTDKLEKSLTEIKEIAKETLWTYSNLDDVTIYNMFDKILQKISECEVGNEN